MNELHTVQTSQGNAWLLLIVPNNCSAVMYRLFPTERTAAHIAHYNHLTERQLEAIGFHFYF